MLHSWGDDKRSFSTVGLGGGRSIRGYPYNYLIGTTAGFLNIEFRLPIIKRLELGFPPISIGGVDGAFFVDIGAATYDYKNFRVFETTYNWIRLVDPVMSFGVEFRLNLGVTMLNFNIAKRTDLNRILEGTVFDWYLGFPF